MNNFVDVAYEEDQILCTFLDLPDIRQSDIVLSCKIDFVQCEKLLTSSLKTLNGTPSNRPNTIVIQLMFDTDERADYCYVVTASNNTATVSVEGTFSRGK